MAVILVWGAQYVGEKLNNKVTRRWSNTVINVIANGWNRLAFYLLDWVSTRPALYTLAAALCQRRLFVMLSRVARGHLFKKEVWHFAGKCKKKTVLDYYYYYYYYGSLHFYLLHRLPFGFRTIAGWQKRENMYRDSTVRQLNHSE